MLRLVFGLLALSLAAQTPWPEIRLVRVADGLARPVDIQSARDGSGRLFVVEQSGRIQVLRNGQRLAAPFLDIQARVRCCGEMGLLGLAFPPDFARKQYFYVNYVTLSNPRQTVVARFRIDPLNPDRALPDSEERILAFDQPFENHNGGQLQFSPRDGFLYIGTGDGGSGGDPLNSGQTPNTLLGKMLRIDTEGATRPYGVPSSNPFLSRTEFRPEIWALGLRNPWRYSFDRETGDLWIADVGQNRLEEVSFQPGTSAGGENYGWRTMEGSQCFNPATACNQTGLTLPVFKYGRNLGVSITGGYVYRGPLFPAWRGTYFTGDYVTGRVWGVRREGQAFANRELLNLTNSFSISTFGEDEAGEHYIARYRDTNGEIYKLVSAVPLVPQNGIVNAASFRPGVVAGSLITIFGAGVSGDPGIQQPSGTPLPGTLSGTSVFFNEVRAPLYAVANVGGNEQINALVPWEMAGRAQVQVTVERGGQRSAPVTLDVLPAQPGVFTYEGSRGVVAFNDSGRLVTANEPASAGQSIVIYATGLGAVDNTPPSGRPTPDAPLAAVREGVSVTIGGRLARVQFAGLTPRFVGLYQINVEVPGGQVPGDTDLVVRVGDRESPPVRIAVR